jgi:hypothetical protein
VTFKQASTDKKDIKFILCLFKHFCHEDVWVNVSRASLFLTSAADGGEWSNSYPGGFAPKGNLCQIGWTTQPVSKLWRRENFTSAGI